MLSCCNHKDDVSMCLNFPNPFLPVIPNAAQASAMMSAFIGTSQSLSIDIIPNVSPHVLIIPYNSASADGRAMTD